MCQPPNLDEPIELAKVVFSDPVKFPGHHGSSITRENYAAKRHGGRNERGHVEAWYAPLREVVVVRFETHDEAGTVVFPMTKVDRMYPRGEL